MARSTNIRKHKRRTKKGHIARVKPHKRKVRRVKKVTKVRKKSVWPATEFEQQQQLEGSYSFFREDPVTKFVGHQIVSERARHLPKPSAGKVRKSKMVLEVDKRLLPKDREYMERQEELADYRRKSLEMVGWEDKDIRSYLGHERCMDPYMRIYSGRRKKIRRELRP